MGKGLSKEQHIEQYLCQYRKIESLVDSHYGEGDLMESMDKRCFIVMKEKRFQSLEQLKRTLDQLRQRKEKAHPNLVEILEYFVCTEDTFCSTVSRLIWVMEYVKKDLAVEIRQRKLLQLPFEASELTQLTYQCISALARLQRDGMLFGDMRSGNILLTNSLEVKLVDPLCEAHPPLLLQALTSVKVPRGTYLAPNLLGYYKLQQMPSLSQKSLHKAEVFALGFILMEACLLNEQDECFDYSQGTIDLKLFQANLDSIQEKYGEEIALLIKNMTTFDERSRPTFIELENILNLNSSMNRPLNASHFPHQSMSFSKLQSHPDRSRNEIRHSSSSILQGEISSTTTNRGSRQINQQDRRITLQDTSGSIDQTSFFNNSETPKETISRGFKPNAGQSQNGGGFIERYSQLKENTESAPRLLSRKSEQNISQKKEESSQSLQQYQHRLQLSQSYQGIHKRPLQSNESFVSNQENKIPSSDYFQDKTQLSSQKTQTKRPDAFTLGIAALGEHGNSANKQKKNSIYNAFENKQKLINMSGKQQGLESKVADKIIQQKSSLLMQQQSQMLYGKNFISGKQQKTSHIDQQIIDKTTQPNPPNQKGLLEDLPRRNTRLSSQFQSFYSTLMSSNKDGNNLIEKGQDIQGGNVLTQGQGKQQLESQIQIEKQEKTILESFIEKEIENDKQISKNNVNSMQLTERNHGNLQEEEEKQSDVSVINDNNLLLKAELSASKVASPVDQLEGDISGINHNSETKKLDDIGRINRQENQLGKLDDLSEIIKGPDQSGLLPFPQDQQGSFQKTLVFQEMPPSNTSAFSLNYTSLPANILNNGSASSIYKYIEETYEDGSVYRGEKFNDKRHGKGRFNYADGGYYEGQWSEGFMEGFGRLYYPSSKLAYEGEWKQDRFTGQGAVYNDTPEELAEGEKFNFSDFNEIGEHWISYEGGFQDDQKQGKGFMVLSNGNKIIGSFLHDMVDGMATCIDAEEKQMRCIFSQNKLVQIIQETDQNKIL